MRVDKYARDPDAWVRHGLITYDAARVLFDAGSAYPTLYFSAATLAHTCLEVLMKGILITEGMVSFDPRQIERLPQGAVLKREDCVWGHSLIQLAEELGCRVGFDLSEEMDFHNTVHPPPFIIRQALEHFEPFFWELRYPHGLEQVTGFGGGDEKVLEELVARILVLRRS